MQLITEQVMRGPGSALDERGDEDEECVFSRKENGGHSALERDDMDQRKSLLEQQKGRGSCSVECFTCDTLQKIKNPNPARNC